MAKIVYLILWVLVILDLILVVSTTAAAPSFDISNIPQIISNSEDDIVGTHSAVNYDIHVHNPPMVTKNRLQASSAITTASPRPSNKPRLLTDYEYENYWDPVPNSLRLGVLLPLNANPKDRESTLARKGLSVIRMAVEDVNRQNIIPGINMSLVLRDSRDPSFATSTGGVAAITAAGSLISAKVSGVIGDLRSDLTAFEALMTSSAQIPQCSFASSNTALSNPKMYPYFYRTIPTVIAAIDAMFEVIVHAGWQRISIVYDVETLGYIGRNYIESKAKSLNIHVLAYQSINALDAPDDPTFSAVKETLHSTESRVQILIAIGRLQYNVLHEMRAAGFMDPVYAWITLNDIADQIRQESNITDYDGLIMVDNGWKLDGYAPYDSFLSKWMSLNSTDYPGAADPALENDEGMAYSCVMMLANAYANFIRNTKENPSYTSSDDLITQLMAGHNTSEIHVNELYQTNPYIGPSGPITLSKNGDRTSGFYNLMTIKNATSDVFATVYGTNYTEIKRPYFKEGYSFPNDASPWTIRNPRWNSSDGIIYAIFCILAIVLTLISAGLVYYYQENIIIKASSPTFCICELLGILIIFVWCILHIGIPTQNICLAESFLLPIGVTLLASALTIKNYRIYRIFNSVTLTNQKFQSRLLVRYVVLAVVLGVVPILVEVLIDLPNPNKINVHSYQWIRCRGPHMHTWWYPVGAIMPILLIIFGVFLAFKTRNIVYLWNEARQIAIVLYNIFFFALIIGICQFFPVDLYTVTFDMTLAAGYFLAFASLSILFFPKFWRLWKNYEALKRGIPWDVSDGTSGRLGFGSLRSNGNGGEGRGGGGFNTGDILSSSAIGRRPEELQFGLEEAAGETEVINERIAPNRLDTMAGTRVNNKRVRIQDTDLAEVTENGRTRRGSQVDSLMSLSETTKRKGNPITVWMNASLKRIRRRNYDMDQNVNENNHTHHRRPEDFIDRRGVQIPETQQTLKPQNEERGESSSGAPDIQDEPVVPNMKPNLRIGASEHLAAAIRQDVNAKGARCGAQRTLNSFVFLLPILVERNIFASLLCHWSMATLILIPDVHAFLVADSSNRKPTSYFMLSMTQVTYDTEPIIRVTTSSSGTLLIRFANQSHLDGWMDLFTEEDRIALSIPRGSISSLSSIGSKAATTTRILNESQVTKSIATGSHVRNRFSFGNHWRKDIHATGSDPSQSTTIENSPTVDKALNTMYTPDMTHGSTQTQPLVQTLTEALAQEQASVLAPRPDGGGRVIKGDNDQIATVNNIIQQYQPSSSATGNIISNIPLTRSQESETLDNRHHPLISPTEIAMKEEKHNGLPSAGAQIPESNGERRVNSPQSPQKQNSSFPDSQNPLPINSAESDDDDDDDLYDPEFGIGGNGRRRSHGRSMTLLASKGTVIPSAEVISAAAAAVSSGWSASAALSAAMIDPSRKIHIRFHD